MRVEGWGAAPEAPGGYHTDARPGQWSLAHGESVEVEKEVIRILDEVLGLQGRAAGFDRGTLLLGALPELDSMAVLGVITAIEERFGVAVADDEISGATFASVGSLADYVADKRRA